MSIVPFLIAISLGLGAVGLVAFLWSLKKGQYEDLEGAAERVLFDEDDRPAVPKTSRQAAPKGARERD